MTLRAQGWARARKDAAAPNLYRMHQDTGYVGGHVYRSGVAETPGVETPGMDKVRAHEDLARAQWLPRAMADMYGQQAQERRRQERCWKFRRVSGIAGGKAEGASGYFLTISHVCMGRHASVQWAL